MYACMQLYIHICIRILKAFGLLLPASFLQIFGMGHEGDLWGYLELYWAIPERKVFQKHPKIIYRSVTRRSGIVFFALPERQVCSKTMQNTFSERHVFSACYFTVPGRQVLQKHCKNSTGASRDAPASYFTMLERQVLQKHSK